jgi:ribonuclease P protein subunit RPR2
LLKKHAAREIAMERITILVAHALQEQDPLLATAQAKLAKKIAMRFQLKLPYAIRQLYCKKCKMFIIPGKHSRVRIGRSETRAVRITCLRCGHVYRKILK